MQLMATIPATIDDCESYDLDLRLLRLDNLDQYQHCQAKLMKYVREVMPGHEEDIAQNVRSSSGTRSCALYHQLRRSQKSRRAPMHREDANGEE